MALMRHFEEACLKGAMARHIHGELHLGIGQEAVAAGMVGHLESEDSVVSTHRNHCHGLAKGVDLLALMGEIFERDIGLCRGRGGHMHPFDPTTHFSATGIVGAALPVALGYAYAFWLENRPNIAVAVTGEGGVNNGTFHECLNIAAAWRLPLVVLVENNGWAISVPADHVMATPTIAERATAYAAWGRKVDGTCVETVAAAFGEAATHARTGKGPAILEATCERFRGHYEGDHDGYRPREARRAMRRERDPLRIARERFVADGITDAATLDALEADARAEIQAIFDRVVAAPLPDAASALDFRFVGERL